MTERLLDTELEVISELGRTLAGDLSVEARGFEQLDDLEDPRQRAIVSDTLLASIDGLQTNLREASEHAGVLCALVGPNGRAMPDPGRPAEAEEMADIDRELVGFFRAIGSALDCLTAVAIVVLRLPTSVSRASAESLSSLQERAEGAEEPQKEHWSRWPMPSRQRESAITPGGSSGLSRCETR